MEITWKKLVLNINMELTAANQYKSKTLLFLLLAVLDQSIKPKD